MQLTVLELQTATTTTDAPLILVLLAHANSLLLHLEPLATTQSSATVGEILATTQETAFIQEIHA